MKKEITIKPLIGLNELKFGSSKKEVESYLGKPNETELIEDEEEQDAQVWNYNEYKVSAFFETEFDDILTCFDISNENATLFGKIIFNLTKDQIIKLMKENGYTDHESGDEDWGEHRLSFNDAVMDFYFNNDEITSVSWGAMIDEDNNAL